MSDESYKNDAIVIINTTDKIFLSFCMLAYNQFRGTFLLSKASI